MKQCHIVCTSFPPGLYSRSKTTRHLKKEQESAIETKIEPPKPVGSETQREEDKEVEGGEEELSKAVEKEGEGEGEVEVADGGQKKEEPERSSDLKSEKPPEEKPSVEAESVPQSSEEDSGKSDDGAKPEPVAPAAAISAPTSKSGEQDGGGGWGWGGWGKSLWSSVSTVTESAQALGHKVSWEYRDELFGIILLLSIAGVYILVAVASIHTVT